MAARRILIFGWAHSVHVQRWAGGLQMRGYHVKVISLGGEPLPDIDTLALPRQGKMSYLTHLSQATEAAAQFQPDLVHVHYAGGFAWWGVKSGREPLVLSVWGTDLLGGRRRWVRRRFLRHVMRRATHITTTSRYLGATATLVLPEIRNRLSIIPFGVELPSETRPMPDGALRICYLKAHRAVYGPEVLLRAFTMVKEAVPDITLTLAGDGELTPRLRALTRSLGVADSVQFPGPIDYTDVPGFFAEHHLLVMPSLSEAFGVTALDAAAAGRPTIATNVGGIPEVVQDGITGLLVAPNEPELLAEAILRLSNERERLAAMGQAARSFVSKNYDWEKSLDAMCDLYEELIHAANK